MPGTDQSTHEVAERTDANGATTRVERRTTETSDDVRVERHAPEADGEPKQVKPDGR